MSPWNHGQAPRSLATHEPKHCSQEWAARLEEAFRGHNLPPHFEAAFPMHRLHPRPIVHGLALEVVQEHYELMLATRDMVALRLSRHSAMGGSLLPFPQIFTPGDLQMMTCCVNTILCSCGDTGLDFILAWHLSSHDDQCTAQAKAGGTSTPLGPMLSGAFSTFCTGATFGQISSMTQQGCAFPTCWRPRVESRTGSLTWLYGLSCASIATRAQKSPGGSRVVQVWCDSLLDYLCGAASSSLC